MDDRKIEEDAAANKAAQLTLEIPSEPEKVGGDTAAPMDVAAPMKASDSVKNYLSLARNAVMHGMEVLAQPFLLFRSPRL